MGQTNQILVPELRRQPKAKAETAATYVYESHGLKTGTPALSKSFRFRVTTVSPW